MTSMPTVSAARGCSPTARLRSPQRVRNSAIWNAMTMTMSEMVIGPWPRIVSMSQPTPGRSVNAFGGLNALNWPAPSGELIDSSEMR